MKQTLLILTLSLVLAAPVPAADTDSAGQGGASSLLVNALRGLSALLPKPQAPAASNAPVATLGIRGSESTTTLLSPYWKDDRAEDTAFKQELERYTAAQDLLQAQRWEEARAALSQFLADHPNSDLVANARFGEAVANVGGNHLPEAADQLQRFVADYPDHPLRGNAEGLAAALTPR